MEDNKFIRGLPNNIVAELDNAELTVDAIQMAKEEFPDNERGRILVKKEFLEGLTKSERIELSKLLEEKDSDNVEDY